MKKGKLEFTSHTANLALMRSFVRRFLSRHPFSEKQRTLMVLGVDEACTNVIRYAYDLRDDQPIALSVEALSTCVRCGCAITARKLRRTKCGDARTIK